VQVGIQEVKQNLKPKLRGQVTEISVHGDLVIYEATGGYRKKHHQKHITHTYKNIEKRFSHG
jgi:hypothetical protein